MKLAAHALCHATTNASVYFVEDHAQAPLAARSCGYLYRQADTREFAA
jgi:hypothetical protein